MCPKLIELLSWNVPTVHICCFMLARASTKSLVSRIYIRQPSPKKQRKKSSLTEKFVSRVIRQPRYHCNLEQQTGRRKTPDGTVAAIPRDQSALNLIVNEIRILQDHPQVFESFHPFREFITRPYVVILFWILFRNSRMQQD